MKTILAFGDSLTWGFVPGSRSRYPRDVRWPKVLQKGLGEKVEVLDNALNARTTVHENPFRPHRSGVSVLPSLLEAHAPLDLVILLLGTNDFHTTYRLTTVDISRGMRRLVQTVHSHLTEPGMPTPAVLIVSPPKIVETDDPYFIALFDDAYQRFHELAPLYKQVAQEEGAHFFDAASVASGSPIDGVHLSAESTIKIGEALIEPVVHILALQE